MDFSREEVTYVSTEDAGFWVAAVGKLTCLGYGFLKNNALVLLVAVIIIYE